MGREAAAECRGCPLYEPATQTVFGEGLVRARVVFVGGHAPRREFHADLTMVADALNGR